ncbi:hypothetical protein H5410_002428 [Solanum commersonii]|uniref:Uncharacterized protein n=1 Tax=Solanum commersonii TaxID=4109 RepID=A0A9J6B2T8_SOLCO|nr:hypothetical protein H5410_002428 [Solanum commersonii]
MDLNFYTNFKKGYDSISKETTTVGGRSLKKLLNEFTWDDDMINYVKGIRLYHVGMDWIGAKRITAVMNMNNTHFVTLEILLHEGRMNVYDCNLMSLEHDKWVICCNIWLSGGTFDSSVETDKSSVETYALSVATFDSYVATHGSSVATFESRVSKTRNQMETS